MIYQRSTRYWIVFNVVLIIGVIGAGWYGGDLALGLVCAGVLLVGLVAFIVAERRGLGIAGVLTGVGDERVQSIYRDATFRTGEMMIYILAIWGVVEMSQGGDNETLFIVMVIYATLWVLNIARASWAARRPVKSAARRS